ncbi:MAG: hypothetical protein WD342_03995 [Verrucomicrobiales bacterium]
MSKALSATLCAIHPDRPAAARCPSCRQFYCAECITEHEGKLTCASCLSRKAESGKSGKAGVAAGLAPIFQIVVAVVVCWLTFYFFAQLLSDMPDEFHDGTIWE